MENGQLAAKAQDLVLEAARLLANLDSFETNLPWRQNRTTYRILLAEFLLVRTRTDVVARVFEQIVERYPDLESLATADEGRLEETLRPLGLRKRVPYLIRAAEYLLREHDGQVPEDVDELIKVPGLGMYTAVAISAFAFGSTRVPADVNILRFLSRLTGLPMEHPSKGSHDLMALLPLLSRDSGGPHSEILLDFTRIVCRPRRPRCPPCSVRHLCNYFARNPRRRPYEAERAVVVSSRHDVSLPWL